MKGTKVSLKDIAEAAQVSTALVSYVLNGQQKEKRVGAAIAAKIKQIAKELNYQPNYLAKSLRSGKTQTLGLIIADISNPFFANMARIVEDEAEKYKYTVIFGSSDENAEKSWKLLTVLLNRHVDGFIIVSSENSQEQVLYLQQRNIPFVLIDRYFPEMKTNAVSIDNYQASFDACSQLINSGYKKVGMIGYNSALFHMHERIRGYKAAFNATNEVFDSTWLKLVNFAQVDSEARVAIDELLNPGNKVDGLIFATYSLAIAGLKYLNELKLKVPDDVAIISFGQAEVFDLYYCPISYVKQPINELAKAAVNMLVEKINKPTTELKQVIMQAKLMIQQSSQATLLTK
jgi:LacI family transcriptional regulator